MTAEKSVSLVVPAYNEEESIQEFLSRILPIMENTGYDYEIVFVDDGSSDRTASIIDGLSRHYPCIRLIKLSRTPCPLGRQEAFSSGVRFLACQ